MSEETKEQTETPVEKKMPSKSWLVKLAVVFVVIIGLAALYYGYLFASTPLHFRQPEYEHYHLRTQIIIDGTPVDFSHDEFQEEYDKTSCSIELTGQPFDYHDNEDQMLHVHWRGVTGGDFLKFYGWNLTGGDSDTLGYRFDQGMMRMHRVGITGRLLPDIPEGSQYYIYIGDENSYEPKNWNDFLQKDLEEFLGKKSRLNNQGETSFNPFDWFVQKAYAHGGEVDVHDQSEDADLSEDELETINNLIGNIVIFVQEQPPTDEQIQERFANLAPLHKSVCGG